MTIEFSNKWYREACAEAGLNPDNVLSKSEVDLARKMAIGAKKYMDAKKNYPDPELQMKFDQEIKRLNEKRIEHMLNALDFAQFIKEADVGFDHFLERQLNRREKLLKG